MRVPNKAVTAMVLGYTALGVAGLFFNPTIWTLAFFLFFALGNGAISHRYFTHNQYKVGKRTHWILALWSTACAYAPTYFWITQHRHHHRFSDTEKDLHSPKRGWLKSTFTWSFSDSDIRSLVRDRTTYRNMKQALKDPAVEFFSRWYVYIAVNLSVLLLVGIADWHLIFTGIGLGYLLEQVRLATINAYTHTPGLPGNYRNFDTKDNSHNNWILMLPTLGFSLHNNHHAEAGKMVMRNKWWEVDIEGYFCYILSLTAKSQKL